MTGALWIVACVVTIWAIAAYVVLPLAWRHHERQPGLADHPMLTATAAGIPGDPINVGVVASREEVLRALHVAGWYPADKLTFDTAVRIAGSVLFDRPYRDAPVSTLFYAGRRQDLAFEKPDGTSPDRRHHVRLWQTLEAGAEGRPVWLGAATFDRGVGLASTTAQITHHIGPDVDAERDLLIADLAGGGVLVSIYQMSGAGPTLFGRNGGGDRWFSDGEVKVGVVTPAAAPQAAPPERVPAPAPVERKQALWGLGRSLLGS